MDKTFWDTAKRCREIVEKWPSWMKEIKITAENANTGDYIVKKNHRKDLLNNGYN